MQAKTAVLWNAGTTSGWEIESVEEGSYPQNPLFIHRKQKVIHRKQEGSPRGCRACPRCGGLIDIDTRNRGVDIDLAAVESWGKVTVRCYKDAGAE